MYDKLLKLRQLLRIILYNFLFHKICRYELSIGITCISNISIIVHPEFRHIECLKPINTLPDRTNFRINKTILLLYLRVTFTFA